MNGEFMFGLFKRITSRVNTKHEDIDTSFLSDESMKPIDKVAHAFMHYYVDSLEQQKIQRKQRGTRNIILIVFAFSGIITSVIFNANRIVETWPPNEYAAVVNINGQIGGVESSKETAINSALTKAFEDTKAKRVVLRINSPGGTPYDAESVIEQIRVLRGKHNKPVDAVIEGLGASAAYMIAVHADRIYAGRYSLTGSVGAKMESWNFHKVTDKFDVENQTFVSGQLKDMLNPYRATREDEKVKIQGLVDRLADIFADEVITARQGKLKLTRKELTTGEVWVGDEAVKLGLVDEIGTLSSLSNKYGLKMHGVGPNEDKGFYIPRLMYLFETISSSLLKISEPQGLSSSSIK